MKIFFNLVTLLFLSWGTIFAQGADPSISGAGFVSNTIQTGETTTLEFSFVNTASAEIPANSIEITIVTANTFYSSDGTTSPTGPGSALFNWSYLGSDVWRGTNSGIIGGYGGGDIELAVTGVAASSGFETTNINVQPVANFNAFSNEASNDNQQPTLKIDQGSGTPCESLGGVGATCTDAYGNTSTIGTNCHCIDLDPCYRVGGIGASCTDINGKVSTIGRDCNCIIVPPTCIVGEVCTDSDGDASVLDAYCNCVEVIVDPGVGTEADPAVTGAIFTPNKIEVGQNSTLTISFANTGATSIPANSIDLTISTASNFYSTDGTTKPAGIGADLFNWRYLGADTWRGRNKGEIPAFGGGDVDVIVTGRVESDFETTNINVQPVAQFGAFKNEASNDNLQPTLKILPPVVDCEVSSPTVSIVEATDPTCAGDSDGRVEFDVTYVTGPGAEIILWNGGLHNARALSGLIAETYIFTAVDLNGCFAKINAVLNDPAPVVLTPSDIVSEECTTFGSVTLTATGGNAPYTYEGTLTAATQDGNIDNLVAGNYTVKATDANGCMSPTINITIGNRCECIDEDKDGVCKEDDCDDSDPTIKYGVGDTCDDNNPCTENDRYDTDCNCVGKPIVTGPTLVGAPDDVTVKCDAIPDPAPVTSGSLTVEYKQERTGNNDCNYKLTRTWFVKDDCGNITRAIQMITVIDDVPPVLVGVPADITININNGDSTPPVNVTATDNCDDNVQVFYAAPSILPDPCSNRITYPESWSATDDCNNSVTASRTVTIINDAFFQDADKDGVCDPKDICPGFDDNKDTDNDGTPDGCEQCDGSLKIVLKEQNNLSCHGSNDGKLVIEIQGGDGPYTTSWTNGSNTLFYSDLSAGTYTLTVKDVNDCRTTQSFTITEPAPLQVNVIKVTPQGCDLNTGAIDVDVTGGTAPYMYNWVAFANTEDIYGLNARNYQLEVTDVNGCKTNRITISVPKECGCDNLTAGGKIGFDPNCSNMTTVCIGDNSTLIGNCTLPSGGSGSIEYLWLSSTSCPNVPPTSIANDPLWTIVPNSNSATLTINNLSQTTCYIRCARRSGCEDYLGESNIVKIKVNQDKKTWYADTDYDTYGDPYDSIIACNQPDGYVPNAEDCDDADASIPAPVGSTCDDGIASTVKDKIQADGCTCKGETIPLGCPMVSIKAGAGQVTVTGLTSPKVILGIFQGLTTVYACNSNCADGVPIPLPPGNYRILIQFRDANNHRISGCDNVFESFKIEETCVDNDKDGYCVAEDCDDNDATLPATPGTDCDDGNDRTINDKVTRDGCGCEGTPVSDCYYNGGDKDNDGICADQDCDDNNPNIPATPDTDCDDGDANTINDKVTRDGCGCEGTPVSDCYYNGGDKDNDGICADQDCDDNNPNIPATPGTDCDDGDANTINDKVTRDGCGCEGTPVSDCYYNGGDKDNDGICADQDCDDNNPNIPARPGTDCDDGNASTTDDIIQQDGCSCEGTPIPTCDLMVELANKIDPGCADRNDGIVAVRVSKGKAPYTYKWSNGKTGSAGITQLVADDYTVSVTDANGCLVIKTYTLVAPDPLMATETITHATCGKANGIISLAVSGGNGTYQYIWNGTPSTASQTNLGAGTYRVIIRDQMNCEKVYTYVVENRTSGCGGDEGVLQPTRCNFEVRYSANSIAFDGNVAKVIIFKGYNESQNVVYSCQGDCPTTYVVANIPSGDYGVKIFNHDYSCVFDGRFIATEGGSTCTDAGRPCNDGDDCTIGDKYDANCNCISGAVQDSDNDGVCDADDICPNGDDNIDENNNGIPDACDTNGCTNAGKPCDDGDDCTEGDKYDANCNCISGTLKDADSDGVCDAEDCAPNDQNYPKARGTRCDDGDSTTTNDVIQLDGCGCAGTPVNNGEPDCNTVTATAGNGTITVGGLTSPIEHVKVYRVLQGGSWTQAASCVGDCGDTWVAEDLPAGGYVVQFTLRNSSWGSICENGEENVTLLVTVVNGTSSRNSTTTTSLSINKSIANTLKVYPNPAQQTVNLDLSKWMNKPVNIAISNHLSQVVYEQYIEQVAGTKQIDLTTFADGLYYIQVQATDEVQPVIQKLIVNRGY